MRSLGKVPLTRRVLSSNQVRHEVVIEINSTIKINGDPQDMTPIPLELVNKWCCSILTYKGFNGNWLRVHASKIMKCTMSSVRNPQTAKHIKVIANVKASSEIFMQLEKSIWNLEIISKIEPYYCKEKKNPAAEETRCSAVQI